MSTQSYEQAISTAREVMSSLSADQLDASTPCESWKVKDVINHIVATQHFFLAGLTGQPPIDPGDVTDGDYLAAFDDATSKALAAFQEDGALQKTVKLPFGEMPGMAVLGLATTDTFTHAWDMAKASGQSTDLAPELAAGLLEQSRQMIQPGFRGADGQAPFGDEKSCPDGACNADRLAAFLGRDV